MSHQLVSEAKALTVHARQSSRELQGSCDHTLTKSSQLLAESNNRIAHSRDLLSKLSAAPETSDAGQ